MHYNMLQNLTLFVYSHLCGSSSDSFSKYMFSIQTTTKSETMCLRLYQNFVGIPCFLRPSKCSIHPFWSQQRNNISGRVCILITMKTSWLLFKKWLLNVLSYSFTETDVNCSQGPINQLRTIIACYQNTRLHKETAAQLIKSNHADSAVAIRKQKHYRPPSHPPLRHTLLPFINYTSLRFTTATPSNKVRFRESFWSYANCMGLGYPGLRRPVSILSPHYEYKSLLDFKLWQL
jgi:hypothetical protein